MTHYELLGVPMDASENDIRRAFREKVQSLHPDRFARLDESKDEQAERSRVFQAIRDAYDTLKEKRKRQRYDRAIQIPQGLADLARLVQGRRALSRLLPRATKQACDGEDRIVIVSVPAAVLRKGGAIDLSEVVPSEFDPLLVPPDALDMPWAHFDELGHPGENEGNPGDLYLLLIPLVS